jgi:signal transduction histidine kinase
VLAHELRTPLATFEVTLELLGNAAEVADPETRQLVERLHRNCRWMTAVVNSALALSDLEQGQQRMLLTPVQVLSVIQPAVALMQPLISQRQQHLRLLCPDPDLWIAAEPQLLGQALVNLLTNASAYSPAGEVIDISVRTIGTHVQLHVTDRGPGIATEEQEIIFDPYVRGSAKRSYQPGLGLGLALTRAIVEQHGGHLGVDSTLGQGASFWLSLPLAPEPAIDSHAMSFDSYEVSW